MQFPASELEFWSLSFSIDDNPTYVDDVESVTLEESKAGLRDLFGD